ncbi:MAG: helix-turn-helix domain-containing protein [Muribaculaceae bacterium]|nr:helix-turn-helix domain-containing protein [Muribaculaceae bacterium]
MEQTLNFDIVSRIRELVPDCSSLDDAYLVAHIAGGAGIALAAHAGTIRMDGMTVLFVKGGTADIEVNMERFEATGPCACVLHHGSRVQFKPRAGGEDIDMYVVFMSTEFLQGININMTAFNLPAIIAEKPSPVAELTPDDFDIMERYLYLLRANATAQSTRQLSLNIGASLVAAIIYELARQQYRRTSALEGHNSHARTTRVTYVHDFVKLVRAHYAMERSVAFYAEKLCISPKYLSLIVKQATGRSAARWIDEFVLMEAKNMLRYSGKNIQQIAYALNFSNQSSFGKYFKHLTGLSPTEYQKS